MRQCEVEIVYRSLLCTHSAFTTLVYVLRRILLYKRIVTVNLYFLLVVHKSLNKHRVYEKKGTGATISP